MPSNTELDDYAAERARQARQARMVEYGLYDPNFGDASPVGMRGERGTYGDTWRGATNPEELSKRIAAHDEADAKADEDTQLRRILEARALEAKPRPTEGISPNIAESPELDWKHYINGADQSAPIDIKIQPNPKYQEIVRENSLAGLKKIEAQGDVEAARERAKRPLTFNDPTKNAALQSAKSRMIEKKDAAQQAAAAAWKSVEKAKADGDSVAEADARQKAAMHESTRDSLIATIRAIEASGTPDEPAPTRRVKTHFGVVPMTQAQIDAYKAASTDAERKAIVDNLAQ